MNAAINTAAILATPLSPRQTRLHGFTMVEMLVVISIVSVLSILVTVGLQSALGTAYDGEVSDIGSSLMRARAYAMANNTYVFVGLEEVDASKPTGGAQVAGSGRLGVSIVASNDGTRIYPSALTSANLTIVSPLHRYENVHLVNAPTIANLPNASASAGTTYDIAKSSATSTTTFTWPLSGAAQYTFGGNPGTVIQFNPKAKPRSSTPPIRILSSSG